MTKISEEVNLDLDIIKELTDIINNTEFTGEQGRSEIYLKNRFSDHSDYWQEPQPRFSVSQEEMDKMANEILHDPEVKEFGLVKHWFQTAYSRGWVNYIDSDYKYWNKAVCQKIRQAVDSIGVDFHKITINELPQQRGLIIHRDGCWKYHYPIRTNPQCFLYDATDPIDQKVYHLEQGKLYNVDTTRDHYVYNASHDTRYHLIMNYGGYTAN